MTILIKILEHSCLGFVDCEESKKLNVLRRTRNELAHAARASVTNEGFTETWEDLTEALTTLGASYVEIMKTKFG